jgi:hypothetical protein
MRRREAIMNNTYSKSGFVHVSHLMPWLGFNTPGTIEASPETIRLRRWGRPFYFRHDQLRIRRSRIALMPVIQFIHEKSDYPRFITFTTWLPWQLGSVFATLRQLGYTIVS